MGWKGYKELRKFGGMLMVAAIILVAICGGLIAMFQAIYPVNPPSFVCLPALGFPIALVMLICGIMLVKNDWDRMRI
jgi:flagellar biosynthesis protein FliQ